MNCPRRHTCWHSKRLYWEGLPGEEQEGKGAQGHCSAMWPTVPGSVVMRLASGLSLASHSHSGSFLAEQALFSQDGFHWEGFWEIGRTCGISFLPFLNSSCWRWLILCSLPGLPVLKWLMQMVTRVPDQGKRFQSLFPLIVPPGFLSGNFKSIPFS